MTNVGNGRLAQKLDRQFTINGLIILLHQPTTGTIEQQSISQKESIWNVTPASTTGQFKSRRKRTSVAEL